jgi:hypothetical protein
MKVMSVQLAPVSEGASVMWIVPQGVDHRERVARHGNACSSLQEQAVCAAEDSALMRRLGLVLPPLAGISAMEAGS